MAGDKNFVLKGNICYSEDAKNLKLVEAGWLVCREGLCAGVFETLPEEYASYPVTDCGDQIKMCIRDRLSIRLFPQLFPQNRSIVYLIPPKVSAGVTSFSLYYLKTI